MTLLIKDVQILGADREFRERTDVFVTDGKIAAIGNFPNKNADEVIDGQGAYLSPGFIDVNTDSDHYLTLFDDPGQEDFLRQGITTIFGGMCGSSLAPLLYGTLESVRKWGGSENKINIDWRTMKEFLDALDRRPLAVNFGTLAGHATIRRAIVGEALRDLTKNELNVFLQTFSRAMKEGAFGLSTGLGYVHGRKTSFAELKTIAAAVASTGGIYATHLRSMEPGGIKNAVEETIKLAQETGASTLINHFVPIRGAEREYQQALNLIEDLPAAQNFHFDISPINELLLPLYTFLPVWAQNGSMETMYTGIRDDWMADRVKKDLAPIDDAAFVVAQAPGNESLVGKSLKDIQAMFGEKDARNALIRLMRTTGMRGTIIYRTIDMNLMRGALTSARALVATNAPSIREAGRTQLRPRRSTATFTTFLAMAEKENLLPLREAVRKITREPAKKFGLEGRGLLKEGNIADLACFKGGEVKFTVVGGKVVMKDGEFRGLFPGKTLRRSAGK